MQFRNFPSLTIFKQFFIVVILTECDKIEKKFGLFVKEKLIEFISSAKEHKLEVIEESDKYGRVLGDIHCDGKSVCSFLLENKYAVEYHGQNKNTVKDLHLENMKLFDL